MNEYVIFTDSGCDISPELLAVNGNIKLHKNYDNISNFCNKYNVNIISLHCGEIEDIGSIICLTE